MYGEEVIAMTRKTTAERLRELMRERNLRQVDVLRLIEPWARRYNVPFFKQNLSLYLKGTVEPNQDKLILLAKALNVSEAWLMGFDVPMERPERPLIPSDVVVDNGEQLLIMELKGLDERERQLVADYIALLKRSK